MRFSAFNDRGAKDPRTSHDFEDIVYILDNRLDLVEQLIAAPEDVKSFLKNEFKAILEDTLKQEAILGNLFYENRDIRFNKIIEGIKQITAL